MKTLTTCLLILCSFFLLACDSTSSSEDPTTNEATFGNATGIWKSGNGQYDLTGDAIVFDHFGGDGGTKDYGFIAELISSETTNGITTIIANVKSADDVVAEVDEDLTGYITLFIKNPIAEVSLDIARVGSPGYGGMSDTKEDAFAAEAPAEDAIGGPFGWNTFSAQ